MISPEVNLISEIMKSMILAGNPDSFKIFLITTCL